MFTKLVSPNLIVVENDSSLIQKPAFLSVMTVYSSNLLHNILKLLYRERSET